MKGTWKENGKELLTAQQPLLSLSQSKPFGSHPASVLHAFLHATSKELIAREAVQARLPRVIGTHSNSVAYHISPLSSSAGMALRMAACSLGAVSPTRRESPGGMRKCTPGLPMAACQDLLTESTASLLLVSGRHDRISTRRSSVRPARRKGPEVRLHAAVRRVDVAPQQWYHRLTCKWRSLCTMQAHSDEAGPG